MNSVIPEATIDLQPYNIFRPLKARWLFPYTGGDVLEYFKSKSLRSFLQNADELLLKNQIEYNYKTISKEEFLEWLPYYQEKMQEHEYDVIASAEWYDDRVSKGKTIQGMFFTQNGKLVGSAIINREGQGKGIFAFKASDRIDLTGKSNSSLGAVIDYFFIREMVKQGVKSISAGQSRNAFGVINTYGYLDYKLRLGYMPTAPASIERATSVPTTEQGVAVFYGHSDTTNSESHLTLYIFKPKGTVFQIEAARHATPELPLKEIEY